MVKWSKFKLRTRTLERGAQTQMFRLAKTRGFVSTENAFVWTRATDPDVRYSHAPLYETGWLTRGLQAKSTSGGCNLHTKVCKCNSSIKNLKFDQIASIFFQFFQKTTPLILIICLTWLAVTSLILSASKRALVTFDRKQLETRYLAHFKIFFSLLIFSCFLFTSSSYSYK